MPAKKTAPYVLLASVCGVAMGAACGNSTTPATPGTAGTNSATAGTSATGGGGAGSVAGSTAGGTTVTAGTAAGGVPAGGTAGTGTGGGGAGGPACKTAQVLNGSGLTLTAPDISAFKYAPPPATHITKMAYDPVGMVVVMINGDDGKMFSFDPKAALPTTAMTSPVTTTAPYNAGYTVPAGYGTGVYQPYRGIGFGPDGALYVLAAKAGGVAISKGAAPATPGGARTWTTIVTTSETYPSGQHDNYNHSFSGIAVSPDGKSLFFSSGSRTEHGEPEGGAMFNGREYPGTSAVFKVPTDAATDLKMATAASVMPFIFADGTRNAFDMAFNANGDLIATDNGPDISLPDEINFLEQGKNYGFPWRFGNIDNPVRNSAFIADIQNPAHDKRLNPSYGAVKDKLYGYDAAFDTDAPPPAAFADPITNMGPDGIFAHADANAATAVKTPGLVGITAHRSPLGISFDVAGALCGEYYKQGFLLSYGPIENGSIGDAGEDLLLVSLNKGGDGKYTMGLKSLVGQGIKLSMDSVLVGNRLFTIGQGDAAQLYVFVLPTP